MPTLQDVARYAGVSTATVSKVLSNTPYFTEETRQKVLSAVQALGYRPNLAARALSSGKTHIIAVVFPYVYDPIFKDPLVMQIFEGLEAASNSHNYNLLLSAPRLSPDSVDESFLRLLQSGYIEGMIAIDSVPFASVASIAESQGIPVVVIGYHDVTYRVRSDDLSGGQMMMRHLLDLGHRDIGIIAIGPNLNSAVEQRLQGYFDSLNQQGIDRACIPIRNGDFSTESGRRAALALLQAHPDLTAIICVNDRMALGVIQVLQEMGRQIPADISVVGYDNITLSAIIHPPLTTIDQHPSQLGATAFQMLLDVLNGEKPSSAVLPPTLTIRRTSGAPKS